MQWSRWPFIVHSSEEGHFLWLSLEIQRPRRAYLSVTLRIFPWVYVFATFMARVQGTETSLWEWVMTRGAAIHFSSWGYSICLKYWSINQMQGSVILAWVSSWGSPFPLTEIDSWGWRNDGDHLDQGACLINEETNPERADGQEERRGQSTDVLPSFTCSYHQPLSRLHPWAPSRVQTRPALMILMFMS